jgi:hypothetical protein
MEEDIAAWEASHESEIELEREMYPGMFVATLVASIIIEPLQQRNKRKNSTTVQICAPPLLYTSPKHIIAY